MKLTPGTLIRFKPAPADSRLLPCPTVSKPIIITVLDKRKCDGRSFPAYNTVEGYELHNINDVKEDDGILRRGNRSIAGIIEIVKFSAPEDLS